MAKSFCKRSSLLLKAAALLTTIAAAAQPVTQPEDSSPIAAPQTGANPSPIEKVQHDSALKITSHNPIYLAYGEPLTKIQFSFRSQLSDEFPLNFAYTQIIFWELRKESKPFLDATYNPEFFYRWRRNGDKWKAIDFGPWEHNSNGKSGGESRSYDQTYVRINYGNEWKNWGAMFSLKLKYMYNNDETNRDFRDYIGPLDFDVRLIQVIDSAFDQAELIFSIRPGGRFGTDFAKGGYQVSANFHIRGIKMNPAFYVQYFRGYAETLINYRDSVDSVRVGLMF